MVWETFNITTISATIPAAYTGLTPFIDCNVLGIRANCVSIALSSVSSCFFKALMATSDTAST